ncbi:MAG: hypothetical protein IAF38_19375 [Bacteroidia bacterium]|nr:hypothetical protein [Bacteroidia bacterium]
MTESSIEIIKRFQESWVEVGKRYDDLINNFGWDKLIPIRDYIKKLKFEGEDKYFRLGTSMDTLMLSRSVNHGLRTDQKYIKIESFDNSFDVKLKDGDKTYREYSISDLNDLRLKKLLKTLKDTLVD